MKIRKAITGTLIALAMSSAAFADEGYDVMKKFTTLPVPFFSKSEMNLDVIEKNGKVEHQVMMQYGNRKNGLVNTVFEFRTSATNKGTRVLQMEKTAKDDDRLIYLPQLKTTRRIPTSDRYKSFVGCEFTYNDMSIRDINLDNHKLLSANETITINGNTNGGNYGTATYSCWKVDSTPASPEAKKMVEYSHKISYIDKQTYLPVKMEYFDKKDPNKLIKTYIIEKIDNVKGASGVNYVLRRACLISNEITGRKTRVTVAKTEFDTKIPDSYFTQNWLTTGKTN